MSALRLGAHEPDLELAVAGPGSRPARVLIAARAHAACEGRRILEARQAALRAGRSVHPLTLVEIKLAALALEVGA